MADPFAAALATLHSAAGSVAAVYTPPGGAPVALRVIRTRPDRFSRFADAQVLLASNVFEIRRADVPSPRVGDIVEIGAEAFALSLEAIGDVEGLTWACGAEPVT